jgi:hypothetical protein
MVKNSFLKKIISSIEKLDKLLSNSEKGPAISEQLLFRQEQHKANKALTSWFGNKIESLSFKWIGAIILVVIFASAALFANFNLSEPGQLNCWDAVYFSIITMTSLGYGDIHPIGFGRFIASVEVLSGIILVAVFVGKVASERQSTLILLLYNSENNRRLKEFYLEINRIADSLDELLNEHDYFGFNREVKRAYKFVTSVYNYLSLHANQGRIADFGNSTSLKKLYTALYEMQALAKNAMKTHGPDTQTITNLERLVFRINGISHLMEKFHRKNNDITAILKGINAQTRGFEKWKADGAVQSVHRSRITETLMKKVQAELPPLPWDKNLNKIIGDKLNLGYAFTDRIIIELVKEGLAPDPREFIDD